MNDEIREILDYLKDKNDYVEDFGISYKRIHIDNGDLKLLLDYITNLQNENERLKDQNYQLLFLLERIQKVLPLYYGDLHRDIREFLKKD